MEEEWTHIWKLVKHNCTLISHSENSIKKTSPHSPRIYLHDVFYLIFNPYTFGLQGCLFLHVPIDIVDIVVSPFMTHAQITHAVTLVTM